MKLDTTAVRLTWRFLGAIAAIEIVVLVLQGRVLGRALAMNADRIPFLGWILAAIVALATIVYTVRALDLGPYLLNVSSFRWLGPIIAIPSSLLEEAVFRMSVMNVLAHAHQGALAQVLASAVTFGLAHAVWGLRGGLRSFVTAVTSMTVLGAMLAIVFLTSGRALLPCVVAHFLINIVLEPWMGYAYALRMQHQRANSGALDGVVRVG